MKVEDWAMLNEQIIALSKKHGQLRQAITKMVQFVMEHINRAPSKEVTLSVIETLRTVTEGKIFVEVERARVTKMLTDIKQQDGDLVGARDTLCELQVETFGSMSRREKTQFILAQVQLCISTGDWTQASILSRKISTRYFARKKPKTPEELEKEAKEKEAKAKAAKKTKETAAAGVEKNTAMDVADKEEEEAEEDDPTDLKITYYDQQIMIAKHDDKYLEACKHYRAVLDTEYVEEHTKELQATLQRIIYFVILAPYDNEQSDLIHRIEQDTRNAQQVPQDAKLLTLFTKPELMRWPNIEANYGPHLTSTDIFAASETDGKGEDPKAHARWLDFRKRVIEHNVRVVAKYYTRIHLPRLTELLDLSASETEKYIADLVVSKTIYARIDRPAQIVSFERKRDADEVLNEWSGNMKGLLGLLERIDHLITKEEMMARIQPVGEKASVKQSAKAH